MSPPVPPTCLSCHGTPQTPPLSSELQEMANSRAEAMDWQDCRYGDRWQSRAWEFELSHPRWPQFAWWVRNNYESTRTAPRPDPAGNIQDRRLPFRIQVDDAQIQAHLLPRFDDTASLTHLLGENAPDDFWFSLSTGPEASLDVFLTVEDNQVLLRSRDLLRSQGILLDGFGTWNVRDPEIHLDDEGMVHLRFNVPYEWWNDGNHDIIINQDLRPQIFGWAWEAWDCAGRPLQCLGLTDADPAAPDHIPLPEGFGFQAIVEGIYNFIRNRPPRDSSEEPFAIRLLPHLRPGSTLETNPIQLEDFFLPGILDLGHSQTQVQIRVQDSGNIQALLNDINFNLDPMGYGGNLKDEGPTVLLRSGSLVSSNRPYLPELLGDPIAPGIQAQFNPQTRETLIQSNLDLSVRVQVPGLGEVEVSGSLSTELTLNLSGEGPLMNPGCTLWLSDLSLRQVDSGRYLIRQGEVLLRNHHESVGPDEDPDSRDLSLSFLNRTHAETVHAHIEDLPHWHLQVSGLGSNGEPFGLDGTVNLPEEGEINLSPLGYDTLFSTLLNFFHQGAPRPGDSLSMGLALSVQTRESQEENSQETLIQIENFDFQNTDARGNPQITLSNVHGNLHRMQEGDDHEIWGVFLIAEIFRSVFGQGNARQGLSLNNLTVEALADQVNLTEGASRVSLPLFRVEANRGQWSREGLLRGPIQLLQRPGHQVSVQWDHFGGSLNLDVHDLAARINLQGIAVAQQMSENIRNFLDPSIHSLGVDGGLEANFTAQFPEDLGNSHARGLVLLHGDRQGDVYWLDRRGRRIGPPIIRDTRWRWTAVNRINLDRGYALGSFHLDTLINLGALMQFSQLEERSESAPTFYGRGGRRLNPWEINAVMPYDNQPATPQGFINRIVDYLETMHRQFLQSGGGSTPTHPGEGDEDS